jgi:hypothetical protein
MAAGTGRRVEYVASVPVPDERGQCWYYKGVPRTSIIGDTVYKSLSGFNYDFDLAQQCLDVWKRCRFKGYPSGPNAFFGKTFKGSHVVCSLNSLFSPFFHGGWIETFQRRVILGPLWQYDLNSAYLWAASLGLPSTRLHWFRGEPPKDAAGWVGIFVPSKRRHDLPPYYRESEPIMVSSEDLRLYDLRGVIYYGWYWMETDRAAYSAILFWRGRIPERAYKLLTQSYWGRWAARARCMRVIYRDGRIVNKIPMRTIGAYGQNLAFAYLIVSRVIQRVWQHTDRDTVSVFVDSILSRADSLDISTNLGGWKLANEYDKGLYIDSAGTYTTLPVSNWDRRTWVKHSGTPNDKLRGRDLIGHDTVSPYQPGVGL